MKRLAAWCSHHTGLLVSALVAGAGFIQRQLSTFEGDGRPRPRWFPLLFIPFMLLGALGLLAYTVRRLTHSP